MQKPTRFPGIQSNLAPLSAGLLCCCLIGLFVVTIKTQTGGLFVYPLDDSYIHLVLARTLATDHVWGIASDHFASASSSPGWTLLLAASDLLIGSRLLTPVFLNLVFVFGVLFAADRTLISFAPRTPPWFRYATAFTILLATPLPNLAITGMEHVAQTLSILLIVLVAIPMITARPFSAVPASRQWLLCLFALCAGALRYEAVFTVLPVTALLLSRRRIRLGLLFAASAAIAPALFGLYFRHMSGFWLPFSVLAKAGGLMFTPKGDPWLPLYLLLGLKGALPLLPLLLAVWLLRLPSRNFWDPAQLLLLLAAIITTEHIVLAPIGWLMRYESYFVCLSLLALIVALAQTLQAISEPATSMAKARALPRPSQAALALICLIFAVFLPKLLHRVFLGIRNPVQAAVDRYDEHIQISRFIASRFDHDTIVVNDIGALAFYSHARLLDAYGLGSPEPLRFNRTEHAFTSQMWQKWAAAENASIAIIQTDPAIGSLVPHDWTLVQRWKLPRNIVFNDFTVSFYAIQPAEVSRLCDALSQFPLTPADTLALNRCPSPTSGAQGSAKQPPGSGTPHS